ncbi:MAG: TrmH family RNA methyltransferase [Flavobacteriaceae bacterium]|nr:TrmH family RNA methyltransferase [Flavobacteriaceae bacterium]
MQLDHYTSKFVKKKFPIVLVANEVLRPTNVGSLFRLADAFGVEKLILGGPPIELNRKVWNTSRATEKVVHFEQTIETLLELERLRTEGYLLIGLEITSKSTPLTKIEFKKSQKIALIIGAERHGISEDILNILDNCYHIEMYGQNSSMNVAQATSIALYELTKKLQNV